MELKIVRDLLDRFNEKILYCHWKSNQHFSDALVGIDDLDILIDRNQYEEVVNIAHELGYKRFYIPNSRAYVGIEDFLGFDYETGKIIHLHLHSRLVVGEKHLKGFHLPIEEMILKNRIWNKESVAYFSSPYDELLLLIIRTGMKVRKRDFYKKSMLRGNTYKEFEWLKEQCLDFEEKISKEEWISERIKKVCIRCFNGDLSWINVYRMHKYLYKDIPCYSQGGLIHNTLERNIREFKRVILEIKKRYINSKYTLTRRRVATGGVIIAFLGSDGSGKSTTIEEIKKWLEKVMDVRYFYLGSGDGNSSVLRKPLKIAVNIAKKFGIIKKTENFNDSSLKQKEDVNRSKLGFARKMWIYTLSRERIKKLICAARCRIFGFVVLTDRYPQDEFDGLCDGPRLRGKKGIAAKIEEKSYRIAKLCPPDLCIKMIVSPEIAAKRKPGEIHVETSRNLTARVKNIKFSSRTKIIEINADQEQSKVWLDVKRAIWEII